MVASADPTTGTSRIQNFEQAEQLVFGKVNQVLYGGIRRLAHRSAITADTLHVGIAEARVKAAWEYITSPEIIAESLRLKKKSEQEIKEVKALWKRSDPGEPPNPIRKVFDDFLNRQIEAYLLDQHGHHSGIHLASTTARAHEWANLLNAEATRFLIQDLESLGYDEQDTCRLMIGACANTAKAFERANLPYTIQPAQDRSTRSSVARVLGDILRMEDSLLSR